MASCIKVQKDKVSVAQSISKKNLIPKVNDSSPSLKKSLVPKIKEIRSVNYVRRDDDVAVVVGVLFNMDVSVVGTPFILLNVKVNDKKEKPYMAVYSPKYRVNTPSNLLLFKIRNLKRSDISSSSVVKIVKNSLMLKFNKHISFIEGLGPDGKSAMLEHGEQIINL